MTGAVTAGLLAGAIVTGVLYADRKSDYEKTSAESDFDAARTLGVVNAILWIGVASGAGLTTYVYVTRPEQPRTAGRGGSSRPARVLNVSGHF